VLAALEAPFALYEGLYGIKVIVLFLLNGIWMYP